MLMALVQDLPIAPLTHWGNLVLTWLLVEKVVVRWTHLLSVGGLALNCTASGGQRYLPIVASSGSPG